MTATGYSAIAAADNCEELRGDEKILPGEIYGSRYWRSQKLPLRGDLNKALSDLDYRDELPFALFIDLNDDGKQEILLTSPDGRLCGNAGCPYLLLDPITMERIGEFFGHPAILDERINGFRIIQIYSRYRVSASSLDTYVYDGKAYRLVSHTIVDYCGLEQWQRRMRIRKEPERNEPSGGKK